MSEDAPQVISIKVRSQHGEEVFFKIKPHTVMEKVIKAFAERIGTDQSSIRLTFDGQRILPTQTAAELELQDNDVIDVMEFMVGGTAQ